MNARTTIRKALFVIMWLCIGGGMLTLLLAAISKKNKDRCSDYRIVLKGARNNLFIDEKDVEQLLSKAVQGKIRGQLVSSFHLYELEKTLKRNEWIDQAELYFDNRDVLHITVTEREPVARIFTDAGNSFYIDSSGRSMPLSEKRSARVPVFTGFPGKRELTGKDSVLLSGLKNLANYIVGDPFWMSQVAQVDITAERKFEMIPVVGNHLVRFGDGENIGSKFNRLLIFYREVLSKTGFDKYKLIDVQYKGQVVASRYVGDPRIDSVQLRKNVERMLRESLDAANDTEIRVLPPLTPLETDSALAEDPALEDTKPAGNPGQGSEKNGTGPSLKKTDQKKVNQERSKKKMKTQQEGARKPKAVMPARQETGENGGYQ